MAPNRTTMPEFARFSGCVSKEARTPPRSRLDAVEQALLSAGREAAVLDDPVLDYLIEMALAEARAKVEEIDRARFPNRVSKPSQSFG